MIKVVINYSGELINSLTVSGHAEYDESGKDIVCAAVSTATITTENAIDSLGHANDIKVSTADGYLSIQVINTSSKTVQTLLKNLVNILKSLSKDYSDYIKIL